MAEAFENTSWIFKKVPIGLPQLGVDTAFESRPVKLLPPPGGIVVKLLAIGLDPHQRDRMRGPEFQSYVPGYEFNQPITNFSVARVIHSDNKGYMDGDLVQGIMPFSQYGAIPKETLDLKPMASHIVWKTENQYDLDWSHFVGPLGLAGMTAWNSFYGLLKPVKGEVIWVNGASSSVGELVVQLAKREGMRVIASVSSNEKLSYVIDELGADAAFNYRDENISDALRRLAPNGLDAAYENIGGDHFQAAIQNMKWFGRIIVCGMASQYNNTPEEQYGVTNLAEIFRRRIMIQGFIYWDDNIFPQNIESFRKNMPKWLSDGTIKANYTAFNGLENANQAFISMFTGKSFGKTVLKIANS